MSRIDPRKGLRVLPGSRAAAARSAAWPSTLDIVGPTVGRPGDDERVDDSGRRRAAGRWRQRASCSARFRSIGCCRLYRDYDVFVLPTLPGEGIPRVLLEAMTAGVPIVTTRVAGIPSLITHEVNGWLVEQPTARAVADAVARIVGDAPLRQRLIANGYETARGFTLEAQAARMLSEVSARLRVQTEAAGHGAGRVSRMVTARRKICFVLPSLAGGGAERAAVQILNGLDGDRWERSMYLFQQGGPVSG